MGRLATWHLPGGPVGPPGRWAATSNVQVGQTTYPASRGKNMAGVEKGASHRGEESREWNVAGVQGPLAKA